MNKKFKIIIPIILAIIALLIISALITLLIARLLPKSDAQIFDENINKVVEIKVSNDNTSWGYGTGCFISKNGLILTNKHMVHNSSLNENYSYIFVRLPNENEFLHAEIVSISQNADLATIKINKTNCDYFNFAKKVNNGEEIYTIGNPNGFGLSFAKGNVSSNLRNVIYNDTIIQALQTSLVINEGNSGGPVFNKSGELLGIISFRLKDQSGEVIQGVSFAVDISSIKLFLGK